VADFYEAHGDDMLDTLSSLSASHAADMIIVGSVIFCLGFLRSLGLPIAHVRLAPYGPPPPPNGDALNGGVSDYGALNSKTPENGAPSNGVPHNGAVGGATSNTHSSKDSDADSSTAVSCQEAPREHAWQLHHTRTHAQDVVRWLSAQRAHGIGRNLAREVRISMGEDLVQGMQWIKSELTLLAYPRECDLPGRAGSSSEWACGAATNGSDAGGGGNSASANGSPAGGYNVCRVHVGGSAEKGLNTTLLPPLIPGLPLVHIGFLRETRASPKWAPSADLSSFLACGSPPIALAFGSMQVCPQHAQP
jgi:hypothetical protein